tara:strand:- start:51 stop:380 length:330 start_codon:yes stop_codon:yes gene_type:complete
VQLCLIGTSRRTYIVTVGATTAGARFPQPPAPSKIIIKGAKCFNPPIEARHRGYPTPADPDQLSDKWPDLMPVKPAMTVAVPAWPESESKYKPVTLKSAAKEPVSARVK